MSIYLSSRDLRSRGRAKDHRCHVALVKVAELLPSLDLVRATRSLTGSALAINGLRGGLGSRSRGLSLVKVAELLHTLDSIGASLTLLGSARAVDRLSLSLGSWSGGGLRSLVEVAESLTSLNEALALMTLLGDAVADLLSNSGVLSGSSHSVSWVVF